VARSAYWGPMRCIGRYGDGYFSRPLNYGFSTKLHISKNSRKTPRSNEDERRRIDDIKSRSDDRRATLTISLVQKIGQARSHFGLCNLWIRCPPGHRRRGIGTPSVSRRCRNMGLGCDPSLLHSLHSHDDLLSCEPQARLSQAALRRVWPLLRYLSLFGNESHRAASEWAPRCRAIQTLRTSPRPARSHVPYWPTHRSQPSQALNTRTAFLKLS